MELTVTGRRVAALFAALLLAACTAYATHSPVTHGTLGDDAVDRLGGP